MYKETYKGRYRIENIKKYKGDISDVIYRSSWELKFMRWCDSNPSVLDWGSETVIIPYRSPVDNNDHRYFVDFYIKIQDKDKKILKYLIEIKPEKMLEDSIVQAKIESAKIKASELGYEFEVWTEMDLFGHVYNKKNMNLFIEKIRNGEV